MPFRTRTTSGPKPNPTLFTKYSPHARPAAPRPAAGFTTTWAWIRSTHYKADAEAAHSGSARCPRLHRLLHWRPMSVPIGSGGARRFDDDEVSRILERAAELQHRAP